jgi:hypothetical protein
MPQRRQSEAGEKWWRRQHHMMHLYNNVAKLRQALSKSQLKFMRREPVASKSVHPQCPPLGHVGFLLKFYLLFFCCGPEDRSA